MLLRFSKIFFARIRTRADSKRLLLDCMNTLSKCMEQFFLCLTLYVLDTLTAGSYTLDTKHLPLDRINILSFVQYVQLNMSYLMHTTSGQTAAKVIKK